MVHLLPVPRFLPNHTIGEAGERRSRKDGGRKRGRTDDPCCRRDRPPGRRGSQVEGDHGKLVIVVPEPMVPEVWVKVLATIRPPPSTRPVKIPGPMSMTNVSSPEPKTTLTW